MSYDIDDNDSVRMKSSQAQAVLTTDIPLANEIKKGEIDKPSSSATENIIEQ